MSEEDRNGAAGADSGDMSTADKKRQATADALMRKITTSAKQMIEEKEKTRLKLLLQKRLKEAGWHDEMADYCREIIRNKSLEHLDISELVQEIAPRSRAAVPDAIREDIAKRIQKLLDSGAS